MKRILLVILLVKMASLKKCNEEQVSKPYLFDVPYQRDSEYHHFIYLNQRRNDKTRITKRASNPWEKLIKEPNSRIDLPKTLDNLGSITRHTFENQQSPMYHVRNLVGSAKNTVLAALRIPPQKLLVPSKYSIVKGFPQNAEPILGSQEPSFSLQSTFTKVGDAIKESVQSGQDTLAHFGEITNSARDLLHSSNYVLPRVVKHFRKEPVLSSRFGEEPEPDQAIVIAPKLLHLTNQTQSNFDENYVKMGHLLDAVGLSSPASPEPLLQKIIFEKQPMIITSRFQDMQEQQIESLENAKEVVGAASLKDFIVSMRQQIKSFVKNKKKNKNNKEEIVGASFIPNNPFLVKPFMNMPNQTAGFNNEEFGRLLSAENLDMFEKRFNETANKNETVGISMVMGRPLITPFMGQASEESFEELKHAYGNLLPGDYILDDD